MLSVSVLPRWWSPFAENHRAELVLAGVQYCSGEEVGDLTRIETGPFCRITLVEIEPFCDWNRDFEWVKAERICLYSQCFCSPAQP